MPDLSRVESLFHQAIEKQADAERLAWLAAECGDDAGLFEEVSALLDARSRMRQAVEPEPAVPSVPFGAYRAVRLLGRGGMSAVYLAERADGQFQQAVALKVMPGWLADGEFLRRFAAERQFLATLNHPNITRLLDGGISAAGDPYLVTEYVDGETIDRYCDARQLSIAQRLRLFLQICEAVDYAHRNLIVHCDLKPANILVNRDGVVKLLDFGAAALTAAVENPTVTRMRMLTPRYASPEQLRGERLSTTTDVFSLGVVLYELLTGAWPYGNPASPLHELDRTTDRIEPAAPASTIDERAARNRGASREQLRRALKGDLTSILRTALEGAASSRYLSVREMASDIEKFLDGRPTSRQQSRWYLASKFLRRRWLPVTAGAAIAVALTAAALVAERQARVAQSEAAKAEAVNQLLNDILLGSGRESPNPKSLTVAEMLDLASARLEKRWPGDPATQGSLHLSLGTSYAGLLEFDRAKSELGRALTIFRGLGDETQSDWALYRLGQIAAQSGDSSGAVALYEEVLRSLGRAGKGAPVRLRFGAEASLGSTLSLDLQQRVPEAKALLDDAISLGNRDPSILRTELAQAMASRAIILQTEGKRKEAEALDRRAIETGRYEDPDGLWQAGPLLSLATLIAPTDPAGAVDLSYQRYGVMARHFGEDTGPAAVSKLLWLRQRADAGNVEGAPEQVLAALEVVRKGFLPSSMDLWFALSSSAGVMNRAKRFAEAEAMARSMFPVMEANRLGPHDGRRAESYFELGIALHGEKREAEAAEALKKAASIYDAEGYAGMAKWAREILAEIR